MKYQVSGETKERAGEEENAHPLSLNGSTLIKLPDVPDAGGGSGGRLRCIPECWDFQFQGMINGGEWGGGEMCKQDVLKLDLFVISYVIYSNSS